MRKIAEMRKNMGITQKELGEMLGVAQNTISAWEKGTREPDIESLKKLCEIFHTSLDALLDNPNLYENTSVTEKEIKGTSDVFKEYITALEKLPQDEFQRVAEVTKAMLPHFKEMLEKTMPNSFDDFTAVANDLISSEDKPCQEYQTPEPHKAVEPYESEKTDDGKPDTP